MLGIVKWVITGLFWGLVLLMLYYTLPQRDVVYITGVEVKREDLGQNALFWASPPSGTAAGTSRDVRFIDTVQPNGSVKVYRNEDTGWSWPPYFKVNAANLQAQARALSSTTADPNWVMIRSYGWRVEFFTIYPNALALREVEGPEADIGLPWFNIIFLTSFALIVGALHVRWRRFKARRLDPVGEVIEDRMDMTGEAISRNVRGMRRWWRGQG